MIISVPIPIFWIILYIHSDCI